MSNPNDPTAKPVTPDYRRVEKLIAAYLYEVAPDPTHGRYRGIGPSEFLAGLFHDAMEAIEDEWTGDEDLPPDVADRMSAHHITLGEYLLRGMIATGHIEQAEKFVEESALRRAECDARFKTGRIPFTEEERTRLAAAWGSEADAAEVAELDRKLAHAAAEIGGAS